MEDLLIVLGANFYFQFKGGGMSVIRMFSNLPYQIIQKVISEKMWNKSQIAPWSNQSQYFKNKNELDKYYLKQGKIRFR